LEGEQNTLSIKSWNEDDRPREKLLLKGRQALSEAELIAILIGSGNRMEDAVQLSRRIFAQSNHNLNELGKWQLSDFTQFEGIGPAKAISIIAALELGRRKRSAEALQKFKVQSSVSVFEHMQPMVGELEHEEFWVLYLNNSNRVLKTQQLSKGGITGTVVDIRLVFKPAIQLGAVAVILVHNHPSGTLKPSSADIQLTKKVTMAGESLDIKVLDHLIVTEKSYFSFADEQML